MASFGAGKSIPEISIGNRKIGPAHPPFIIAEMSGNHAQFKEKAFKIIEAAAASGVDALKLQTYTADTMTLDIKEREFFIDDPKNMWRGNSLYDLYAKAHTPWEWHPEIVARCRELGLICFSTPFDESAVDFLESLDVPCYKVASFENTDLRLIRRVASTGKPVIISTGMASVAEMDEAVRTAREAGCRDLVLLKCTSSYPAPPSGSNIATIPFLRELFDCQVGLSDHTLGIGVPVASVALGATVIEKHFNLSRSDGAVDAAFSAEPAEMKQLVEECRNAWQSVGQVELGPSVAEKPSLVHRRSLYVSKDLKAGDRLSLENVRAIRPGLGLPVKYLDVVLGKKVKVDVARGTPVAWSLFD